MSQLPVLPISSIGSLPKPPDLFRAEMAPLEQQDHAWMRRRQETAVADWIATQEKLGIDVLVDGEQYRRSMTTYFLEGWGCADIDPDPVWVLDNMYGQRAVIKRPATAPRTLLLDWYRYAASHARSDVKVTVTGPYTLRDWVFDLYYSDRRAAVLGLAEYVREEVQALVAAGVRYLQIDEPAFVTRYDQPEELDVAIEAMQHICTGLPDHVTVLHAYVLRRVSRGLSQDAGSAGARILPGACARLARTARHLAQAPVSPGSGHGLWRCGCTGPACRIGGGD